MEPVDLLYVAYHLGHAKPTTTLMYYAHWTPRGDKAHLDRMIAACVRLEKGLFRGGGLPRAQLCRQHPPPRRTVSP